MAKSENQKLKLLYLAQMLQRETDEDHGLTMREIIEKLAQRQVCAERKSIYDDLDALERFGLEIVRSKDSTVRYSLGHRTFELPELKLLVDAVQSSRFLSVRKSRALIAKLESLASCWQAGTLQRQVYVAGRVKSMNESIYYSIDTLHAAIGADRQITFLYYEWTMEKKQKFRHNGARYSVSPYALLWSGEYYYLVAYDSTAQRIKHFRVDKMSAIALTATPRAGKQQLAELDLAAYADGMFNMFGGQEQAVELEFAAHLAGVVLDRFGREVTLLPVDEQHFKICTRLVPSPQFKGWLAGFGTDARIVAPAVLAQEFADLCRAIAARYETPPQAPAQP